MLTLPHSRRTYLAVLAIILCLTGMFAVVFGYMSPDSWYYTFLAQGLRHGAGCVSGNAYMAIYPCGYPFVLAVTAPSASLQGLMVSSKLTNLLLLAASFFCVWRASGRLVAATLMIVNPVTLNIAMYTWSENLLLFCTCGTFLGLAALAENHRRVWPYALLGASLVLGVFSRYFFGPYAFLLFLSALAAYGRWTAMRALPLFVVAGAVYLGYLAFNKHMVGFGTGMARTPAPESIWFLLRQFVVAFASNGLGVVVIASIYLGMARGNLSFGGRAIANPVRFMILAGLSFLALALFLRLRTQFDPFDTRTIGYGVVFLAAGTFAWLCTPREETNFHPVLALLASGLLAALFADGLALPQDLHDMFESDYAVPALAMSELQRHAPHLETIVYFRLPIEALPEGNVDNVEDIYYGDDTSLVSPSGWPDDAPDTPKSFLNKLDDEDTSSCAFDFTAFSSLQDFKTFLDQSYLLDHRLWPKPGQPAYVERRAYDPGLEDFLLKVAQPGKLVPCRSILDLPLSRAVRAVH